MFKNVIKKADILLAVLIIVVGLAATAALYCFATAGSTAVITVGGEVYGTYSLDEDNEITVEQNGHTNKVIIKDGAVSMEFSDCKNQVCVNQGWIKDSSKAITCLPNRVMVTIEGEGEYDVTTN